MPPTQPPSSPSPVSSATPPDAAAAGSLGAPSEPSRGRSLAGAVRAVSGVTLLSRIGGLARDVIIGRLFAASPALGSAFAAAFQIPNMFRRLFGEGALSAAFIPEYTDAQKSPGREDADRIASLTIAALGLVTGAVTVAIELVLLALLLTLPYDPDRAVSLALIMVMIPFMPLICIVATLGGMLQVHGKFAASSTGPLLLNAFIIAVGAYFLISGRHAGETTAFALGIATVLSGLTQALWFWFLLRRDGRFRWTWAFSQARDRGRRMFRRFVPVVVGLGTLQLNAFIDTLIAMWPIWVGATILGLAYPLDESSNLILFLAQRLYQFPLGVFGIAVATAAFPMLARHANDPNRFADTLRRGLRLSLFIGLPASVGLILVRHDIVAALYSGGASGFTPEMTSRAAMVVAGYAPGIWAYSLNHVLTRAFYARGDTRTPMGVAIAAVGLNLALNAVLIWPLGEAGMAWATSASAVAQCIALGILCRSRLGVTPVDRTTATAFARVAAATALMTAAVLLAAAAAAPLVFLTSGWSDSLFGLVLNSCVGVLAFALAAFALRLPELSWLTRRG